MKEETSLDKKGHIQQPEQTKKPLKDNSFSDDRNSRFGNNVIHEVLEEDD